VRFFDVIGSSGGSTEQDAKARAEIKAGKNHRIGM